MRIPLYSHNCMSIMRTFACCAALALAAGLTLEAAVASSVPSVGVCDFYALTPVPPVSGVIPEEFAADDFSAALAARANERYHVIARPSVRAAERDIRWRGSDVLSYGRLTELARRLHSDRLVVGWIRELVNASDVVVDGGNGPIQGSADVTVQVFDATQGRVIAETQGRGDALGAVRGAVTEEVLSRAVEATIPAISPALAQPSP
jgi:hypothetical protein